MPIREHQLPDLALRAQASRRARPPRRAVLEEVDAFLDRLEALADSALRVLAPADAAALDALAVASARGAGAYELAVGEGLDLLARTGGDVRLGFSGIGDLSRERLGIAAQQARRLRRNAVALRSRPLLREAVLRGEVSVRKAEVVLPVAIGADEACWVERARLDTVRRLELLVRSPDHAHEDWHRIRVGLPRAQAEVVEGALEVAKIVLGPTAPLWKRLWAIAAEFLSTHPIDPRERMAPRAPPPRPAGQAGEPVKAGGGVAESTPAPGAEPEGPACPPGVVHGALPPRAPRDSPGGWAGVKVPAPDSYAVLERLVRLVAERAAAEERLGRVCLLVRRLGLARRLGYSGFDEYCAERLGLAPSTARQRIAFERRVHVLPELRAALRARRLTYEQARLVARAATPADVAARIDEAAGKTCIALLRDLEAEEHRQMWCAEELRVVVPDDVGSLLDDAIRAARLHLRGLTPGEALVAVARHFIETWAPEVMRLAKGADPVILRDGGLCQVPGCSRAADHVHHLWFRSAGGPLEPWNELSLCAPHHVLGVHRGNLWIAGRAPDALTFVLGEREVAAARA